MDDKTLEQHFTAIQETLATMDEKFSKRLDQQDVILGSIFEIIKEYDTERKAIKSDIWDLKRAVAELQLKIKPT